MPEQRMPVAGAPDEAHRAAEQLAAGVAARSRLPRTALAAYTPSDRDPVALLEAQNATRLPALVPLRMTRMAADPFAFFRGSAALMAADLGREPSTDIDVISCGDAHVTNFGFFASPLRTLVFDLNDFDEAATAPWEWDVKRLVTSAVIGARQAGFAEREVRAAALGAAEAYRIGLRDMMQLGVTDRFYARLDTDVIQGRLDAAGQRILQKTIRQARRRTSASFVAKSTVVGSDGRRVFVDDPPVLSHAVENATVDPVELFAEYRETVAPDVAVLLDQYELTDTARRVVGVGSVGTRCFVALLTGPLGEPLVLQVKEAPPSVLESHGGRPGAHDHQGSRVVESQRVLQAVSDVFLGHLSFNGRDFYVRQFRDMKTSVVIDTLTPAQFVSYARGCGIVLARAHAQSPRSREVAGYLGDSSKADRALVGWALAYAEQSADDHRLFAAAVSG